MLDINLIKRIISKPPSYILRRIYYEIKLKTLKYIEPHYPKLINKKLEKSLVKLISSESILSTLSFFHEEIYNPELNSFYKKNNAEKNIIISKAQMALNKRIDLLGTGNIFLGDKISWNKDYKTGKRWKNQYFNSIDYNNLDQPSDVKIPWEISRLQWIIPLGQVYILTQDEKYAKKAKELILDWIDKNPYAYSVNWACTMEVALRIIQFFWFYFAFSKSPSWKDHSFYLTFLKNMYLHVRFTSNHLEKSDVNGNHYTANAAGLVFGGLFFYEFKEGKNWFKQGWSILESEIEKQVYEDGVDYEASISYHRLVSELFLYPAIYSEALKGFKPSMLYLERLKNMALFIAYYNRPDGSTPLWGDSDDARTLPFGSQNILDHRYLVGLTGLFLNDPELLSLFSGNLSEIHWIYGIEKAKCLSKVNSEKQTSRSFPKGGFYIMRDRNSHIFIDCGPLGLAGRGGHGHNDLLSFEAWFDGCPLFIDSGSYIYTGDYQKRNLFRSTQSHNTPQIDGEEINRFIRPDYLWNLHNDAKPTPLTWETSLTKDIFEGSHNGYERLKKGVLLKRRFTLDKIERLFSVKDVIQSKEEIDVSVPYHLHPDIDVIKIEEKKISLKSKSTKKKFLINLEYGEDNRIYIDIIKTYVSFSYGVKSKTKKLTIQKNNTKEFNIKVKVLY